MDVGNESVEAVSEDAEENKEPNRAVAKDETEEQNQKETLPKGWKRKGIP